MSIQIQQAREILIDLKRQINESKKIWEELTKASLEEDADLRKQWCDHEAMCWIHASTSPEKFNERSNYFPNRKGLEHVQASR